MWVMQWIQVPTTHTTGGPCWRLARCLVEHGRVVAVWYDA